MKKVMISLLVILGSVGLIVLNEISYHHTRKEGQPVVKSDSDYDSLTFLKLENNKHNVIYSPLSINYALNMLSEGTNGVAKDEINNLIDNIKLLKYDNIDNVLSLANAIFVKDGYTVEDNYINTLKLKYMAEVKYDDFSSPTAINDWISVKTFNLIKNPLNSLSEDTKVVLVNALAIVMDWQTPFDYEDTYGGEFVLANGETMEATMMHNNITSDDYSYYISDEVTAVSMNLKEYGDRQLEFVAFMPQDLESYITEATMADIDEITNKMIKASDTKAGIIVNIPRFKFDYELNFMNDLSKLGVKTIFTDSADLTNIGKGLFISDVKHVANIDFSEEGIKAAAVTIFITSGATAFQDEPVEININRPFMFLIRDKKTKDVLFVGSVYEPNKWANDEPEYQKAYNF